MNPSDAPTSTTFKVGIFTILGLLLVGALTIFVNDRPFWWRPCQLVHINVEDGTGLKAKSPIKSLGIEIGYLKTVDLSETHVDLGICITAPVEVLPSTRAYLRGEGFLGDKFVELKPVKYIGPKAESAKPTSSGAPESSAIEWLWDAAFPSAYAMEDAQAAPANQSTRGSDQGRGREIPVGAGTQDVQQLVNRVDALVNEATSLTNSLKQAINPEELRSTMKQLNRTLENASKTLSPEGGLNQTAQRTLAKLEDAIEQMRDQLTRINKGTGSVGMLLNDPTYAEEIREAIRNVNRLLSKVGGVRFVVDLGGENLPAFNGGRGYFKLQIYPKRDRYYLIGIALDPRGKITQLSTTTQAGGRETVTQVRQVEQTGLLLTAMLGKIFYTRADLSIGALNGDGAISTGFYLGPTEREEMFILRNDLYSRGQNFGVDDRITLQVRPWVGAPHAWSALYLKGGLEGFKRVVADGPLPWLIGAGVTFDDEDIKMLFAFL